MSLASEHLTLLPLSVLTKITAKGQLTLSKRVIEAVGNPSHFEVEIDCNRLILTPSYPGSASTVRRKLQALNLLESDVTNAVTWARSK